jgi:hypothetical protein
LRTPSPRKKFTDLFLVRPNSASFEAPLASSSATMTPFGSVDSSIVIVYSAFSGTPIFHLPSAPVSTSAE